MQTIAFIGVGRMGNRMANRLLDAGYPLVVYDPNEAAVAALVALGAKAAASAAVAASSAEIVIVSLPTPPIVEAVALGPQGVIEGSKVRTFIDMSTTGSTFARRIAAALKQKSIVAVDAPVSGGISGAERGTVAIMVSCPESTFEEIKPVLSVLGKPFLVGKEPGQGQTMKLLNNLLSAAAMTISCEAAAVGVKAGLDPSQMIDVFNAGSGRNSATQDKMKQFVISRTFGMGFAIGLLNKDVKLCLEEAEALGVPMVVGSAVRQLVSIATAEQGPDSDMTAMAKSVEQWAGIQIGGAD